MTNKEKLQAEYSGLKEKVSALLGKETLTEAEGVELKACNERGKVIQDQIDQIDRASAMFSSERVEVVQDSADQPWEGSTPEERIGNQLIAIARAKLPAGLTIAGRPTGMVDRRLYGIQAAAAGMNEAVPSEGGFLVGTDVRTTVMDKTFASARLASMCQRIPISTNANGVSIPYFDETSRANGSRMGGVQAYWANEAGSATAKKPKLGLWEKRLEKIIATGYATNEVLEDAAQLGTIMVQAFSDEIAFKLDDGVVRGDGVGKILGLLSAPALVSVDAEGGQAADTINAKNILNMYKANPHRETSVWITNSECIPQLAQMTIGVGNTPVWLPAGGFSGRTFDTIFGRPVVYAEQASALGDQGDIIFVDLSEFILIEKGGIQAAQSMHVNFLTDEMCFRLVYRVNGAPAWNSAVTPFKGAQTLSPYVTLDARA